MPTVDTKFFPLSFCVQNTYLTKKKIKIHIFHIKTMRMMKVVSIIPIG